jgi:hypothetical protein
MPPREKHHGITLFVYDEIAKETLPTIPSRTVVFADLYFPSSPVTGANVRLANGIASKAFYRRVSQEWRFWLLNEFQRFSLMWFRLDILGLPFGR